MQEQALVSRFNTFLDTNNMSMSAFARSIGVSPAAISAFKKGNYKGDNATLSQMIEDYLDSQEEKRAAAPKQNMPIFSSSDFKMVNFIIKETIEEREIGLIYGAAGSGKTTALREFAKKHPNAIFIEATAHTNARSLLDALGKALKISMPRTLNDKIIEIASFLKTADKVLLIDEAEHLPLRALEDLRRIHDFSGVPLVLAGTLMLLNNLRGKNGEYRQLYSRIASKWSMKGLSEEESNKYFKLPVFPYTRGNFRSASKLSRKILKLAKASGQEVNERLIKAACEMIIL